jgi:hypothetical protein
MKRILMGVGLLAMIAFVGAAAWLQAPDPCPPAYHSILPDAIKVALPSVHQPDDYSCGAAALMSILAYYDLQPEDYGVLRRRCRWLAEAAVAAGDMHNKSAQPIGPGIAHVTPQDDLKSRPVSSHLTATASDEILILLAGRTVQWCTASVAAALLSAMPVRRS